MIVEQKMDFPISSVPLTERLVMLHERSLFLRLYGTKYSRINQVKFFKGYLPQTLLGTFLNILSYMTHYEDKY